VEQEIYGAVDALQSGPHLRIEIAQRLVSVPTRGTGALFRSTRFSRAVLELEFAIVSLIVVWRAVVRTPPSATTRLLVHTPARVAFPLGCPS
jgi:hypothetical protein